MHVKAISLPGSVESPPTPRMRRLPVIMGLVTVGRWPRLLGNQGGKSLHLKQTTCARARERNGSVPPAGVTELEQQRECSKGKKKKKSLYSLIPIHSR